MAAAPARSDVGGCNPALACGGPSGYSTYVNSGTLSLVPNNINSVELNGSVSGTTSVMSWDEFRIGNTYASVVPLVVPSQPTITSVSGVSQSVTVNWSDVLKRTTNTAGFHILRTSTNPTSGGETWTTVGAATGALATSFVDSTVSGGTYYYEVSAYDASGNSLNSNPAAVNVPSTLTATTTTLTANQSTTSNATQALSFTATVSGGVPNGETVTLEDASNSDAVVATGSTTGGNGTVNFTVPAGTLWPRHA